MTGGNSVSFPSMLFTEFTGRHARGFFELSGKIRDILEAAGNGDIPDAHFILCQKLLGFLDTFLNDIIGQGAAGFISENMGQIIRIHIDHGGQHIPVKLIIKMAAYVFLNGGHDAGFSGVGNTAFVNAQDKRYPLFHFVKGYIRLLRR